MPAPPQSPRRRGVLAGLALLATSTLTGCLPPRRPPPASAAVTPPPAWREQLDTTAPLDAQWWRAFGDPALDALVAAALARSSDVLGAIARVDEARAQAAQADAARLPALNGVLGLQAGRALEATGIGNTRAVQPQLAASWEPDLFGRIRSARRAAALQYRASQAERDGVLLAVAAATVQGYLGLLALDAQLTITRATGDARAEALRLAQDQARVGYISQLQLTQAQSELEAVLAALPELELAVRRQENALRLLAGELPGAVPRGRGFAGLALPPVPQALPSSLLARRPDIVARELQLAALDANLALRRQAFLPQVTLSAQLGSLFVNALDYDPVTVWSIGGSVLAPLFSGGRLNAQYEAAAAGRDAAAFAYRRTVLTAFSEVENALAGLPRLAQQVRHAEQRRAILARSLGYARDRYEAGYASYLEQLDAQRNLYGVELNLVTLRRTQMENMVSLYRALGGGWSVETLR